jgi:hypothetical protein
MKAKKTTKKQTKKLSIAMTTMKKISGGAQQGGDVAESVLCDVDPQNFNSQNIPRSQAPANNNYTNNYYGNNGNGHNGSNKSGGGYGSNAQQEQPHSGYGSRGRFHG